MTTFGYDQAGRLVHARNPDAEIPLDRDVVGRVTAETCNGRTVRSAVRRRRAGSTAASRRPGRRPAGNTTRPDSPVLMTADGHRIGFGYDPAGRETRRELPGGLTLTQDWDPLGQLTVPVPLTARARTAAGRLLQRRAYTYRPDGFVDEHRRPADRPPRVRPR